MAIYNLATLIEPQFIATSITALVWAPKGAGGLTVVPALTNYIIGQIRVTNVTGTTPAAMALWRVPAGSTAIPVNLVVPVVHIPPGTNTIPAFDATPLWGAVLLPGDAIFAEADTASALTIYADGIVSVP